MRLTLRTLLAYMDEILDSGDQEALSEKIESSDFAADLIHRTRDTMRRLRLSAPQAVGTGLGLDPNTVAEYLDNTLTPENVADLERICLESDVHLAEVASCHHILTMVLGEPAEIDPDLRSRMYTIANEPERRKLLRADAAHADAALSTDVEGTEAVPVGAGQAEPSRVASSSIHEVPEYLRASRWSPVRVGAKLLAVAAILAVVGIYGFGMFGDSSDRDLAQQNGESSAGAPRDADATNGGDSISTLPESVLSGTDSDVATAPPIATDPGPQVGGESPVEDRASVETPPDSATQPADSALATPPPNFVPEVPTREEADIASNVTEDPDAEMRVTEAPNAGVIDARRRTTDDPRGPLPPPEGVTNQEQREPDAAAIADAPPNTSGTDSEPPAIGPTALGTFWSERDVLLRYNAESSDWFSLETGTTVRAGDNLLTLPTFRPTVALNNGVGVKLIGGTAIVLGSESEMQGAAPEGPGGEVPILGITYGRVVLLNSDQVGKPIHVVVGEIAGTVHLDAGATVAFEVVRKWVPGHDPRQAPSAVQATAFVPDGGVSWTTLERNFAVDGPSRWEIRPDKPSQPRSLEEPIAWIAGEQVDRLERLAADQIRESLVPDVPAALVLLDLSKSYRSYEQALATRCGAYVGQFSPFVRALGDSDQRSVWSLHIETLRASMAQGPESAARVRRALFDERGAEAADDLYEMLCGYTLEDIGMTAEQRQHGALDRLINWLEHDSLDYRVLAAHNLRDITGKALMQNPAGDPDQRERGVRRWRERLRGGELEPLETYGW